MGSEKFPFEKGWSSGFMLGSGWGKYLKISLGGGQLKYFWIVHPESWGFMIQIDYYNMFETGWFNHPTSFIMAGQPTPM